MRNSVAPNALLVLASSAVLLLTTGFSEESAGAPRKLGPVGEQESKPALAAVPVSSVVDPGVIPSRQNITPAGLQSVFESRVYGVALDETGQSIYAATPGQNGSFVYRIGLETNQMMSVVSTSAFPGMQGLAYDSIHDAALLSGLRGSGNKKDSKGQLIAVDDQPAVVADGLGSHQVGGIAVGRVPNSHEQRPAVMALTFDDEAAVIDVDKKALVLCVKTGVAPFNAVVSANSPVACVSNWGRGRFPMPGERTAATGSEPGSDQVVVDERGVLSSGTVARIDLESGKVTASIEVGLHPSGLAWNESRQWLYVANSNSDSISVIDTATNRLLETMTSSLSPETLPTSPRLRGMVAENMLICRVPSFSVKRRKDMAWQCRASQLVVRPDGALELQRQRTT